MRWLGWLADWWWRWLLLWTVISGVVLVGLLALPYTTLPRDPVVVSVTPAADQRDVLPRVPLMITFSEPMDQASVQHGLVVEPATSGIWHWAAPNRASWTPAAGWQPATTYTVRLASARSRLRQPLATPVEQQFTTTAAPTVVFSWPPPDATIEVAAPIVVRFSRPMIAADALESRGLPELNITPPVSLTARWSDVRTVVIDLQTQPASVYTATLAGLADLEGTPLETAHWRWRTAAPHLLTAPVVATPITPTQPISWTFAGVLDSASIDVLTASLAIVPPIDAEWQVRTLLTAAPSARLHQTELTLLPARGWQTDTSYTATYSLDTTQWHWTVRQPPTIIGTVPGIGGTLPPAGELRVLFSTSPDPALAATVALEPAVPDLAVEVDGDQVRVRGDFAPSTSYTLTLQPDTSAAPFALPFTTSRAAALLQIENDQPSVWAGDATPQIAFRWRGIDQVQATLYPLDRALLTTLLLAPPDTLDPVRYKLEPAREWVIERDGTSSTDLRSTIALTATDAGPLQGAYLLRLEAPVRRLVAQQLVVISPYTLQLAATPTHLDVWAIDRQTAQPFADLPLVVLRGGSQIAAGSTDATGRWTTAISPAAEPLLVLGGSDQQPAIASVEPPPPSAAAPFISAVTDRSVYTLGDELRVLGVVEWNSAVPSGSTLELALKHQSSAGTIALQTISLTPAQAFSATLPLRSTFPPGAYDLRLSYNGRIISILPVHLQAPADQRVRIDLPPTVVAGTVLRADIRTQTTTGRAAPGEQVQWEITTAATALVSGTVASDLAGWATFEVPIPADLSGQIIVHVATATSRQTRTIAVLPAQQISLEVDRTLAQPNQTVVVTATVRRGDGTPVANAPVAISISSDVPPELANRSTAADGTVQLRWRLRSTGQTTFSARSGDTASEPITVWAATPNFRGWPQPGAGELPLALEHAVVAAGTPIRVLPLLPATSGTARLLWNNNGQVAQQFSTWTAGVPLSLTLPLSVTGAVDLHITLLIATANGVDVHHGTATVHVAPPVPLHTSISVQTDSTPATINLTTTDAFDVPVQAKVALVVRPAPGAGPVSQPLPGLPLVSSQTAPTIQPAIVPPNVQPFSATSSIAAALWLPALSTDAHGQLTVPLTLPASLGGWQIVALASTPRASSSAIIELPGSVAPTIDVTWPEYLSVGDVISVTARLAAGNDVPLSATVNLSATAGLNVVPAFVQTSANAMLAVWNVVAQQPGPATLVWRTEGADLSSALDRSGLIDVQPAASERTVWQGFVISDTGTITLTLPATATGGMATIYTYPASTTLIAGGWAALRDTDDLLATAGRISLAVQAGATPSERDLTVLQAAQHGDGGWSWANSESDPLITALIVQTLAPDHPPGLAASLQRAERWLAVQLPDISNVDTRALIVAALAYQHNEWIAQATTLLSTPNLDVASRVMLLHALAQQGYSSRVRGYLPSLLDDWAQGEAAPLAWLNAARNTALLGQLLIAIDPADPELTNVLQQLAAQSQGTGWGDALATTEALRLLRTAPLYEAGSYQLMLNDRIWRTTEPLTLWLPLSTDTPLSITATAGLPLAVATRWNNAVPESVAQWIIAVPANVVAGQSFEAQASLILFEPQTYVDLALALPAGVLLEAVDGDLPLDAAGHAQAERLDAGVYVLHLRLHALLPGTLHWPAPRLRSANAAVPVDNDLPLVVVHSP